MPRKKPTVPERALFFLESKGNGHRGVPLSMALVGSDGNHWYCEFPLPRLIDSWTKKEVLPKMYDRKTTLADARLELEEFLNGYPQGCRIIAVRPDVIVHLMELIAYPRLLGLETLPTLSFELHTALSFHTAHLHHNALSDAKAMMVDYHTHLKLL